MEKLIIQLLLYCTYINFINQKSEVGLQNILSLFNRFKRLALIN